MSRYEGFDPHQASGLRNTVQLNLVTGDKVFPVCLCGYMYLCIYHNTYTNQVINSLICLKINVAENQMHHHPS